MQNTDGDHDTKSRRPTIMSRRPPGLPRNSTLSFPLDNAYGSFPNSPTSTSAPADFLDNGVGNCNVSTSGGSIALHRPCLTPTDSTAKHLESKTSSSIFQNFIIVVVIMSCLIAFFSTTMQDLCEEPVNMSNCSLDLANFFPIVNIAISLTIFVIFFFHTIGYCDSMTWQTKTRIISETLLSLLFLGSLVATNILAALFTSGFGHEISSVGIIASGIGCLSLAIRCCFLIQEIVLLFSRRNHVLVSQPETSLTEVPTKRYTSMKKRSKVKRSFSTFRSKFRRFSFSEAIDFESSLPVVKLEEGNKIVLQRMPSKPLSFPDVCRNSTSLPSRRQ